MEDQWFGKFYTMADSCCAVGAKGEVVATTPSASGAHRASDNQAISTIDSSLVK